MTNQKTLFITGVVVLLVGAALWFFLAQQIEVSSEETATENETSSRIMSIESYITANISVLSPIKEQLGGTFYVTDIEAENGSGVVEYEDGHNAYVADFIYEVNEESGITIKSFIAR